MNKITMALLAIIYSGVCFSATPDETTLNEVRAFIAKTRYLVSNADRALANRDSVIAMNKDMDSLYKEGIDKYGITDEHPKMSPYSDCAAMSTNAYNLWGVKSNPSTDGNQELIVSTRAQYEKSYKACKKTTYAHMLHESDAIASDNLTVIDVDETH
ncbi:hypothetical protein ACOY6O_18900 [Enterobacter roggenkampii]|uniref:hypothetical protein n=1 Tax=Enterobacter roggenkampii TaxID=1812935 RepID=UPI0027E65D43|nr:hypothetical protein [Enterobacter roggenkampii]